jgi:hypothetical protein
MRKRTPHHIFISFSGNTLTHFGGIYLLQLFFKRLQLRKQLHHHLQFQQRNNRYTIAEEMLTLIYPITLSLGRIETAHLLKHNGVFQYLTGLPNLSQPDHLATFPSTDGTPRSSQIKKTSRPAACVHDTETRPSCQSNLRSGFDRPYPLWQTGDGPYRLQSPKTWQTLLASAALLQRDHQGLLARGTSPRRCSYRYGNTRSFSDLLCQTPPIGKARNYKSRQGLLRSQDHRIPRVQKSAFCHCRQAHKANQEKTLHLVLPDLLLRHRDRRVHVPAHEMEKAISFRRDQASRSRRSFRATHPFLHGQIQLPGHCNKYEAHSSQCLEVLQWPSIDRTDYRRAQRGLSLRKNPDKVFCGQRSVFSYSLILVQSHQLVQALMSPKGISTYDS